MPVERSAFHYGSIRVLPDVPTGRFLLAVIRPGVVVVVAVVRMGVSIARMGKPDPVTRIRVARSQRSRCSGRRRIMSGSTGD